jgi:glyoxylase-like metal-dependent hydrolase (beta-lactamase superfamily II)
MQVSMTRSARRRTWLVVGGLTLLVAASVVVLGDRWRRDLDVPRLGGSAVTLVSGVHYLGGLDPSAAYAVETSDGLVLVDAGLDDDAGRLRSQAAQLGLDWRKVRAVLLTHAHGDHSGGAAFLREATGAKIYAGKGDAPVLRSGGPREAFFSTFYMPDNTTHPTPVDVELSGGETLEFGDVRVKAVAAPGHTPGSICYLLERGNLRLFFAGDVISMLVGDNNPHPMGLRPLGTYSAYLSPRYRGDGRTSLESLKMLRAMKAPDLVLPGHPHSDPTPESPRLSRQRWEAIMDQGIREMETLLGRYEADGRDFLDGNPKTLLPGLYYFGDFKGTAVYGLVAGSKFIVIDAPGGSGLVEFLKARQKQLGLPTADPAAVLLTSCNPNETAGLSALVEQSHCQVVAPKAGLQAVKELCPPGTTVLTMDELVKADWFKVTPIPLRGRGVAPVAYVVPWAGKTVLFSGRIPILFDQASMDGLSSDLSQSRATAMDYLVSINKLEGLKPDLWLPAVASDDQNANLYDDGWKYVIENNYRAGYSVLERIAGRR